MDSLMLEETICQLEFKARFQLFFIGDHSVKSSTNHV